MNVLLKIIGIYAVNVYIMARIERGGWKGVGFAVLTNLILVFTLGRWEIEIFGWHTNIGNIYYSAVFFGTSIMCTKYSFHDAMRMPIAAYVGALGFIVGILSLRAFPIVQENADVANKMLDVFSTSGQLILASGLSYFFAMRVNIPLVQKGHKIIGNILGQLTDTILFFPLAFGGIIDDWNLIFEYAVTGFVLKSFLNIIDTPFFWWSTSLHHKKKGVQWFRPYPQSLWSRDSTPNTIHPSRKSI